MLHGVTFTKAQLEAMFQEAAHELGETNALALREPDDLMGFDEKTFDRIVGEVDCGSRHCARVRLGELDRGAVHILIEADDLAA